MTGVQTTEPSSTSLPPVSSPTQRTLIGEIYSLPFVNRLCDKVSSTHATLSRVLPLYSRLVTTFLSVATALASRVSRCRLVSTAVHRVDAVGLLVLDTVQEAYLRPGEALGKVMDVVHDGVMRAAAVLATHPLARLPCRVTLAITDKIPNFLEAIKLDVAEDELGPAEVFGAGRLYRIYNQTLSSLTHRLRTCHSVLEDLHKGTKHAGDNMKENLKVHKRKRSVNFDLGESSTSDDSSVSTETAPSEKEDDEYHQEAAAPPVNNIDVTKED